MAAWAALAALRLPIHPNVVLDRFGSPLAMFHAPPRERRRNLPWTSSQLARIEQVSPEAHLPKIVKFLEDGGHFLPFDDPRYPGLLKQISKPPAALWCRGDPSALRDPLIAIVGSRKPTPYGRRVAGLLSRGLVVAGIGVVSGGAYGVDAASHAAAMDAGGRTVAVLGTGIDRDYPAAHAPLFARMAEHGGACVTEFPPGTPPRPGHFPVRNRVISGLARGVVVVEAGARSGALITARFAMEQNREVFAVPGELTNELSVGPHALIRRGAVLVTGVEDILEEITAMFPVRPTDAPLDRDRLPPVDLPKPLASVWQHVGTEARPADDIIERSGMAPGAALDILTQLEILNLVERLPGQRYRRL